MRKIGKTILTIVVVLFSVLAAGLTALSFGIKLVDRSGWAQNRAGELYYLDWVGEPQTGWKTLEGNRYYFDPQHQGAMTKGWLEIDSQWYYFAENGVMQTGWMDLLGSRFYLNADGTMVSGWQEVDGKPYFFDDEGEMQIGWLEVDGRRFYLGADGVACFGWQETEQGRCYLTQDGTIFTQWQEIDGKRYYFNEDGYLMYGWLSYENEYYYLDDQGVMQTGWLDAEAGRYYLDETGCLQTGWLTLDGNRYFMGTDGIMDTGWTTVGGYWYFLGDDGIVDTGWLTEGDNRYYLAEDGRMHTGWLDWDGDRYYMDANGVMCVGTVQINGTNHFFTSQGKNVLLVNPWNPVPEGYAPDLVPFEEYQIDRSCLEPLKALLDACAAAGGDYGVNSVYRSLEDQQKIWDERMAAYRDEGYTEEEALELVSTSVAVPGTSEHHLGLAVDVGGDEFVFTWLRENAWKYGFIVRYPEGTTELTGIIYEPWHIRYVGLELAQELYELDLCMEAYMAQLTK